MATHYQTLGVGRGATAGEVRQAYLHRARALHPDRAAAQGETATPRAMQDVNEAWRVLGDPVRRAAYDRSLDVAAAPMGGPRDADDVDRPYVGRQAVPGDVGLSFVRGLPWIVALLVLGIIFVFTAFAGGSGDGDERVRPSDLVGGCVQVQRGADVVAVPCTEPNEGRVDLVVHRSSRCPSDSSATPMAADGVWLCLRDANAP
ncbi:MAG TPA: DnaJ domain-containing protein [Acidimicrobiales bacterium]|nr:DnaJ domain-containing protein [Acidimicrobiales bacterium]